LNSTGSRHRPPDAFWLAQLKRLRKRASRSRCGWRRCIWMFMPETSSTRQRATG
jgi:hypothetical protein